MRNIFGNNVRVVACCVLLLTGCTQLAVHDDYWLKPQQARPGSRAGALMLYYDYVHNLSAGDYTHELDHVRQLAAEDKSQFRQLQYALALLAPGGDVRRAQQVIDGVTRESRNADPELAALSNLVSSDLAERRRLEARIEAGTKRADELEKKAAELGKKVEAVKNIEKTMIERDKSAVDKP